MPEKFTDDIAGDIVIYAGPGVELALPIDRERETIWATQAQIAELFGVDRSRVTRHVNNVFRDEEVDKESNVLKAHIASSGPSATTASTSYSPSDTARTPAEP
ncbi:MAG: cytochrome biosis protein CycH [Acidimicrobiaceae bacterium]|nr:cytochrome biosis protein CycH [Acidimicrobiaceae bacterium]